MKKVFIDSDVILDVFLKREPHYTQSAQVLSLIQGHKVKGYTSPLVFANVFYILRKLTSANKARDSLKELRLVIDVLPLGQYEIDNALVAKKFKDFEDALQSQVALRNKASYIITRNIKDYRASDIQALTPKQFLHLI